MAEVFLISLNVLSSLLFIQIARRMQQVIREKRRYLEPLLVILILGLLNIWISSELLAALIHHLDVSWK